MEKKISFAYDKPALFENYAFFLLFASLLYPIS